MHEFGKPLHFAALGEVGFKKFQTHPDAAPGD
jgi:hypothetical protein